MPRKASGSRLSSTECRVSATVAAISGRLTQKIARQESARPAPRPRPVRATVAIPVQAVQVPTALPRSAPSKVAATIASEPGTSSAPAIPCRARAAIRNSTVGAIAQSAEAGAEGDQADDEHPPPAELIAERAADQKQRDQGEHVGLDDPLLSGKARVEPVGDRRQGDVDHGRVEEDDGRAEDRRDQGQALPTGHSSQCRSLDRRTNLGF